MDLEDLHNDFWINSIKKLHERCNEITFRVVIQSRFSKMFFGEPLVLDKKIKLMPRKKTEMAIFENWYKNTPKKISLVCMKKISVQNINLFGNESLNEILTYMS
jgi:hypothetical protein